MRQFFYPFSLPAETSDLGGRENFDMQFGGASILYDPKFCRLKNDITPSTNTFGMSVSGSLNILRTIAKTPKIATLKDAVPSGNACLVWLSLIQENDEYNDAFVTACTYG